MVKLPQSSLGYCVDGNLTRVVPVRNKKDCDDKIISPKIIKKTVPPSTAMNESFQNSLKPEDVEEIKVAVKKGELSNALLVVEEMMSRQKCYSRGRTELELLVLCLFALNIEKRTPVYFAALTGRTKIVKFLLCLLIMHRRHSWMNESLDPFLMLSLQEWLNKLGYIDSFKSMDLDACILNSLNQSTRNAISVEKFTLSKIVSFAISTTSACCDRARVVDIVMKQTAKRKHMPCSPARPLLNTDDIRFDAKYHHNRRARFYDEDRNDRVNGDRETAGLEFTTQETNASSLSPSNTKPRSDAQQSQREHEDLARALSLSLHPHEQRMSQDEMIKLALEQSLVDCPGILTPSWAGHDNITAEGDVDSSVVELSQEGDNLRLNNKTDALIDSEYIVLQNGPERISVVGDDCSTSTECWDVLSMAASCTYSLVSTRTVDADLPEAVHKTYRIALLSKTPDVGSDEHTKEGVTANYAVKTEPTRLNSQSQVQAAVFGASSAADKNQCGWMDATFVMEGVKGSRPHSAKARQRPRKYASRGMRLVRFGQV